MVQPLRINIRDRALVAELRRLAGRVPGLTTHATAILAVRAGLAAVERDVRDAARALVADADRADAELTGTTEVG